MAIKTIQGDPAEMTPGGPFFGHAIELAARYCLGNGIELGAAAHNPFNLPGSINVAPFSDDPNSVDYHDFLMYRHEQIKNCGYYATVDLVGEAHAIPVTDRSQDYIISSHVVEHLPDLLAAFREWNRVLRPGGVIFMIFPKRDAAPSDVERALTPLHHFIEDYYVKRTIWTHAIEGGHGIRGHYHLFTLGSMLELIQWGNQALGLAWSIEAVEETDSKVGNGHTVVCRYLPAERHPMPSPSFVRMRAGQLWKTSSEMLRHEGVGAFSKQTVLWLRGKRRYFNP